MPGSFLFGIVNLMKVLLLLLLSAIIGFATAASYNFAQAWMKNFDGDRLKPKEPKWFILYQLMVLVRYLAFIVPYAFVLLLPINIARYLKIEGLAVVLGAWAISFLSLWIGQRFITIKGDKS